MDLLDYLTKLLECTYLSDLHFTHVNALQIETILAIPDGQFSIEQYQMAVDYITGKSQFFKDLSAARLSLLSALQGQSAPVTAD